MSWGQILGAILGIVVGILTFSIFGWYGIVYGAIIGYTIGGYIDPVTPDVKQPGAPAQQGLQLMPAVIGNPIFDVLGTAKITGQLLFFGKEFNRAIWYRPGKGVRAISGYKYYASWTLGICMGPVDALYTIFRDQDPIWEGELTRPESGVAEIQIEGVGWMAFHFGTDNQAANPDVAQLLPDPTLNTGLRHLCWAYFHACFMNEYNRMPSMSFIVRKTPPMFSESTSQIQTYDINPAHALWYTLINKAGFPEEWLHTNDFLAVATTLFGEGRGISILFDTHQSVQNYLEAINSHVDNILRYGSDGKFHPKLIRYDYIPAELPVIDESKLLEEPTFSRRSWIDTINEVKVQYSEILGERITHPYLIGWYKFNEGSGLVAYNSATDGSLGGGLLPNLTVQNGDGYFWSYLSGFGSTTENTSLDFAYKKLSAERTFFDVAGGGHTWGMFFKKKDINTIAGHPFSVHEFYNVVRTLITIPYPTGSGGVVFTEAEDGATIEYLPTFNTWCFIFLGDDGKIKAVSSDGTLMQSPDTLGIISVFINYIHVGVGLGSNVDGGGTGQDGCMGSYGDVLIYNAHMPTLAEWAVWYDQLRGRYGMAARSGW